jgi:hypothetical protein
LLEAFIFRARLAVGPFFFVGSDLQFCMSS